MTIVELQRLLWQAITWPTGVADFLATTDDKTREAFRQAFVGTAELDAVARVNVYAESYYWRLHEVLEQ